MMNYQSPTALLEIAEALQSQGRFADAVNTYQRVIAAEPGAIAPRVALGNLFLKMGRPRAAMAAFEQAVHHDPRLKAKCRDVDASATEEAQATTVLANCGHILALYPAYAEAHYGRAKALLNLGREDEARRACERALALNPTVPTFYHVLIHTGDPHRNASAVSSLEQLSAAENELSAEDRATLHFLLAKAYDDQARKEDAFKHLTRGNAIKRGMITYKEADELGRLAAIATTYSPARLEALSGSGTPSDIPLFVIGMPRSGTTLVEQILASHPDIYGAGELDLFPDMASRFSTGGDLSAVMTRDALTRLGEDYLAKMSGLSPSAKRIVDKQPYNFLYAGLIHLALPNARILHVRRDPLDTCFSCFGLSFAGSVGFAYDLAELGRYYRAYKRLMDHWSAVLPSGTILEVRYEDLVADLPSQAQRMVAYCGLEWDARCLDFHKSPRAVATASLHQVRQPLYKSSIGRARAYWDQLGPLRAALELG